MNMIQNAKDQVLDLTVSAYQKAAAEGLLPQDAAVTPSVEIPKDTANGDYTTTFCLAAAKALKKNPRQVAQILMDHMDLSGSYFTSVEMAGPGFLNFRLGNKWFRDTVACVEQEGAAYGCNDTLKGRKIMVEFVSANPTGPMHMGNARGGALGDCLAAVMDFAGYDVSREFYINDAGNQIDKFALSLDIRYQQIYKGDDAPELPEDSYHGEDIAERAKEFAEVYGDRYISESEEVRRKALVDFALPKNIDSMHEILSKYRIEYDTWFKESTLHNGTELHDTIELLKEKGLTYELDGALWYKNTEVQTKRLLAQGKTQEDIDKLGLKDDVLIRQNGNPTYFAADIAYHRNKLAIRKFDRAIDIWGADHHGHVARMKGALDALGLDGNRLDIVLMQLVRLTRNGEVVRMSKRTGKAITLVDLLEEIPIDAVRFFFNLREPATQMEFDLDLAIAENSQNPVYYCQYAHARICSILRKLKEQGCDIPECTPEQLDLLTAPEEREIIRHLASLTDEIVLSAKNYDPARITRYCIDLATLFHKFYNACRVNCDDKDLSAARIYLCLCVKEVLKNILTLLKISVPERM